MRARCCPDSCCWDRRNGSCHKILESLYRVLRALFELGQQRGEIRRDTDAMQLAELLIAIYHFTTINWLIGWWDASEDLEPRTASALEVFFDGCRARSAVPTAPR